VSLSNNDVFVVIAAYNEEKGLAEGIAEVRGTG